MSAICKALNTYTFRPSLAFHNVKSSIPIPSPIPSPIDTYDTYFKSKSYKISYGEMIEIPPPYCNICRSFLTSPSCNQKVQPKTCPLIGLNK